MGKGRTEEMYGVREAITSINGRCEGFVNGVVELNYNGVKFRW